MDCIVQVHSLNFIALALPYCQLEDILCGVVGNNLIALIGTLIAFMVSFGAFATVGRILGALRITQLMVHMDG